MATSTTSSPTEVPVCDPGHDLDEERKLTPELEALRLPTHWSQLGVMHVLVVEDDAMQQEMLRALFDAANKANEGAVMFQVAMAGCASEAMDLLYDNDAPHFQLIMLDLVLPDQMGTELLPRIRERVGPDVAIVMASVHSKVALVQGCVIRGADAFLVKPLALNSVQHLWQYVKELPDGSFKSAREKQREESFNDNDGSGSGSKSATDAPVPGTADGGASSSRPKGGMFVLEAAGALGEDRQHHDGSQGQSSSSSNPTAIVQNTFAVLPEDQRPPPLPSHTFRPVQIPSASQLPGASRSFGVPRSSTGETVSSGGIPRRYTGESLSSQQSSRQSGSPPDHSSLYGNDDANVAANCKQQ